MPTVSEKKRATQISMPYVRSAPMDIRGPEPRVEKAEARADLRGSTGPHAMARPDATPVSGPIRSERAERGDRTERGAAAAPLPPPPASRLASALGPALGGDDESELDIPAFLRHPPRSLD